MMSQPVFYWIKSQKERKQKFKSISKDEKPYDIPKSWTNIYLGDICDSIRGVTYKKSDSSNIEKQGSIAILRANNIKSGLINYQSLVYIPLEKIKKVQILQNNDILIATSSGSVKLVGKASQFKTSNEKEVGFGAFCLVLRLNNKNILSSFFGWYFQTSIYHSYISSIITGTNINNLKTSYLEKLIFPLPPQKEQRRIVQKIETCFEKIDVLSQNMKSQKKLLKKLKESILQKAFQGQLVPQIKSEGTGHQLLKKILADKQTKPLKKKG